MHSYLLYHWYTHMHAYIKPTESVRLCSFVYVSSHGHLALANLYGNLTWRRLILPLSTVIGPV